ncbi:FAD-binding oxidoreductase [Sphingomonas sinipercae]|uniref:FAD-binding oxidoreductase n=1 Tax=Sphingomonas sinipercae TaxID=2714944 RepID=A0A6G7ZPF5_9SPHN|nr:FAD-dependent oxidoreductase [Sphingomonas sinipercae]QIL02786.1 FAD-binding oxidoreductase [Sphingomonas sinipercae]
MDSFDIIIVGGGIAGANLGAELAAHRRVLIVEAERHCGMHATGRSAAFWLGSYGGPAVAPLTLASRRFLAPFLRQRGALHIARDVSRLPEVDGGILLGRSALEDRVPGTRPDWACALFEESCADIDVAALHADCLARFRQWGGTVRTDASLVAAERQGNGWKIRLSDGGEVEAGVVVNAAGAWADAVAIGCGVRAIGIQPKRRTMVQLRVGQTGLKDLPLVIDAAESFYFKGEGDNIVWLSPHDEIDSDPCDAAPEEIDVAVAIHRFEQAVDWPIEAVERRWAGLRSFSRDRVPVYGFDPSADGFFWCAGQGGFGIQTAPAAAKLAASLLLGEALLEIVGHIDPELFSPGRFSR